MGIWCNGGKNQPLPAEQINCTFELSERKEIDLLQVFYKGIKKFYFKLMGIWCNGGKNDNKCT